jgi:hypothetical protein
VCRCPGWTKTTSAAPSALASAPSVFQIKREQSSPPDASTQDECGIHCSVSTLPEWPTLPSVLDGVQPAPGPIVCSALSVERMSNTRTIWGRSHHRPAAARRRATPSRPATYQAGRDRARAFT